MSLPLRSRPAGPPAVSVRPTHSGIGRSSSEAAEQVSDDLRRHDSPALRRRRRAGALNLAAVAALALVETYQLGLLRRVPELPLPGVDADAVDASGEAYVLFGTPDSALGLASYAGTLALIGMGAADRATRHPWIPLLTAAKVSADVLSSGYLFAEQVTKHRKICTWCTAAALASLVSLPTVLPEAREALATMRRG